MKNCKLGSVHTIAPHEVPMQLMIVFEEIIRVIFYAVPQLDFLPEWAACFPEDDVEIQAGVRTVRLSETQDYYQDATKDCLSEFTSVEFYAPDDDIDATIVATNWLRPGATWSQGDFNSDGTVDDEDAALMAANWQSTWGSAAASVPEPSSAALLMSALVAIVGFRRRLVNGLAC